MANLESKVSTATLALSVGNQKSSSLQHRAPSPMTLISSTPTPRRHIPAVQQLFHPERRNSFSGPRGKDNSSAPQPGTQSPFLGNRMAVPVVAPSPVISQQYPSPVSSLGVGSCYDNSEWELLRSVDGHNYLINRGSGMVFTEHSHWVPNPSLVFIPTDMQPTAQQPPYQHGQKPEKHRRKPPHFNSSSSNGSQQSRPPLQNGAYLTLPPKSKSKLGIKFPFLRLSGKGSWKLSTGQAEKKTVIRFSNGDISANDYMFTLDPGQLKGELFQTTLLKGPHGFGFTIIGSSEWSQPEFLQVSSVLEGGPAATTPATVSDAKHHRLLPGDIIVYVNNSLVLGCTPADVVSLLQLIDVGKEVTLTLCRGYPLPPLIRANDSLTKLNLHMKSASQETLEADVCVRDESVSTVEEINSRISSASTSLYKLTRRPSKTKLLGSTGLTKSSVSSSDQTEMKSTPGPLFVRNENGDQSRSPPPLPEAVSVSNSSTATSITPSKSSSSEGPEYLSFHLQPHRPEIFRCSAMKTISTGLGFNLVETGTQGSRVVLNEITNPVSHSVTLSAGDVILEINNQRVREMSHAEILKIINECPVDQECRLLVQRGGILFPSRHIVTSTPPLSPKKEKKNGTLK